jgi:hypothetical protein
MADRQFEIGFETNATNRPGGRRLLLARKGRQFFAAYLNLSEVRIHCRALRIKVGLIRVPGRPTERTTLAR